MVLKIINFFIFFILLMGTLYSLKNCFYCMFLIFIIFKIIGAIFIFILIILELLFAVEYILYDKNNERFSYNFFHNYYVVSVVLQFAIFYAPFVLPVFFLPIFFFLVFNVIFVMVIKLMRVFYEHYDGSTFWYIFIRYVLIFIFAFFFLL